ncbi:hypothetical protein K9M74_01260 [Candidatus Woesearchaeota archaeon]|nr:hypothetical protein [Candidatus Woesearchaeota archaeon]
MVRCNECNTQIRELPFKCKFCGQHHCSSHRLPEDHHCTGLPRKNLFHNLKGGKRKQHRSHNKLHQSYQATETNIIRFAKRKYHQAKYWLNRRQHRKYTNWNNFFMNLFWIAILSVSFGIIYSNIDKLNEIILWFIPLGGALILMNIFFLIKYLWKFIKRIGYWYKGERNWIKYLVLILILLLVWQGYQHKDTIFDKAIEKYNEVKFSNLFPFGISDEISEDSLFSKKSVSTITEGVSQQIKEVVDPDPISDKTMDVEKAILKYTNAERRSKGLSSLKWDSKLATVARDHSLDMVENDFFSHDNLKGEDPTDRAIRHGYNVHKELGGGWYSDGIAENIGKMPTGDVEGMGYVSSDADSIAKAHVESWMDSPGHRANILESKYSILAVGCAYDGLYYVCTQNFY